MTSSHKGMLAVYAPNHNVNHSVTLGGSFKKAVFEK